MFEQTGTALPQSTAAAIRHCDGAIFGATQSPSGKVEGYSSPILALRKQLDLYANLRPITSMPVPGSQPGIDMLIVRENTECLYVRQERLEDDGNTAVAQRVITRRASERIARIAFEQARRRAGHTHHAQPRVTDRAQGQRAQPDRRPLPRGVPGRGGAVPRRAGRGAAGRLDDLPHDPRAAALRCGGGAQPLRRHPERRRRRPRRRVGAGVQRQRQRQLRPGRTGPRQRARHRRQGHRQPGGHDPGGRAAAGGAGRGRMCGRRASRRAPDPGRWHPGPRPGRQCRHRGSYECRHRTADL